ncbi:MAG TPA: hypothetical protein VKZ90_04415 [Aequorivita sp.]|nr:hypothetical protein [Aequorivita sp.]
MANISYNQIHATLDEATMASILQKIQEILNLLPKGTLNKEERKQYRSLDVRNLGFVEDALRVKNGNKAALLPPLLKNDNMQTDLALGKQLRSIRQRLQDVEVKLNDLERIVGHECFGVALTHYKLYKIEAKAGDTAAKAAVEQLEWRFKKQGDRPLEEL